MPQGTNGLLCLCIGRVRQNRHTPLIPLRVLRLVPRRSISGAGFWAAEEQDLLLAQVQHGLAVYSLTETKCCYGAHGLSRM